METIIGKPARKVPRKSGISKEETGQISVGEERKCSSGERAILSKAGQGGGATKRMTEDKTSGLLCHERKETVATAENVLVGRANSTNLMHIALFHNRESDVKPFSRKGVHPGKEMPPWR